MKKFYTTLLFCILFSLFLSSLAFSQQCDIVVQGTPTISPDPVTSGNNITVSYIIHNNGPGNAGTSQTKVQIKNSSGTTITQPTFSAPAINANSNSPTQQNNIAIPSGTPAGTYTAYVILDNLSQLNQSNIGNDYTPGVNFTVQSAVQQCDIVVQGTPTISPDPVTSGNNITVSYIIHNNGPGNAGTSQTKVQIKNSSGTTITQPTFSAPAINANSNSPTQQNNIAIPSGTPAGTYTAYVILDNLSQLNQSNIGNDYTPGVNFTVQSVQQPDINVTPTSLTIHQGSSKDEKKIKQDTIISDFEKSLRIPPINNEQIESIYLSKNGNKIIKVIMPGTPPKNYKAPVVYPTESSILIPDVPAYEWSFGCTATSAAMIAGYYDRNGFQNIYSGPTNNGVMPLDNSVWGSITINGEIRKQCPLSVSRNGLDGRTSRGHVDDYWIQTGNAGPDPFIINSWPEHVFGDCLGDYMRTNQSSFNNSDGATILYSYVNGLPYSSQNDTDGTYGMKLFFEARSYSVVEYYNQLIYGYNGNQLGFTFNQFKQEIDNGNPVLIHVEGHSMLGYGYDNISNTIYLHDTWDYENHTMTWGGQYGTLQHWGVSVIHLSGANSNSFEIANVGNGILSITNISDNKDWLSTTGYPSLPFNISSTPQTVTVNIDWNLLSGTQSGIITISSNDPDEPTVNVEVTAIGVTDVTQQDNPAPSNYFIEQNFPNPFNPDTKIKYSIPQVSHVELRVFDILGNEIATLVNEEKGIGVYEVDFNASSLSSGIYIYNLKAGEFVSTKKMMVVK